MSRCYKEEVASVKSNSQLSINQHNPLLPLQKILLRSQSVTSRAKNNWFKLKKFTSSVLCIKKCRQHCIFSVWTSCSLFYWSQTSFFVMVTRLWLTAFNANNQQPNTFAHTRRYSAVTHITVATNNSPLLPLCNLLLKPLPDRSWS